MAIALKDVAAAKITRVMVETVPESGRQDLLTRARAQQVARDERRKLETAGGAAAEVTQPRKIKISKAILPGAAEAAKAGAATPERPQIPKLDVGRKPEPLKGEARHLGEPSIDRSVDHAGRMGGKAEPVKRPSDVPPLPKPEERKPQEQKPPKPDAGKPAPSPKPDGKPEGKPPAHGKPQAPDSRSEGSQ